MGIICPEQDSYGIITRGYGNKVNKIITRGYGHGFRIVQREILKLKSTLTQNVNLKYGFITRNITEESDITLEIKKRVRKVIVDLPIIEESTITQRITKRSRLTKMLKLRNKIRGID